MKESTETMDEHPSMTTRWRRLWRPRWTKSGDTMSEDAMMKRRPPVRNRVTDINTGETFLDQ